MIEEAESGRPVYIADAHRAFAALPPEESETVTLAVDRLDEEGTLSWELRLPRLAGASARERDFVRDYVHAEVYNILSSVGGRSMTVYVDGGASFARELADGLSEAFCVGAGRKDRRGYGRSVNVIDRMLAAVESGAPAFRFVVADRSRLPPPAPGRKRQAGGSAVFRSCAASLEGKAFCGIDVGGTDIKAVLVDDGLAVDYKEYDWFPANFLRSRELVDPILLIARLLRVRLAVHRLPAGERRERLLERLKAAMDKAASDAAMTAVLDGLEAEGLGAGPRFDGIGLCFPDVVVRNKIVGGEVYKTRGIRTNPDIDYESDFAELTDLDLRLAPSVREGGAVRIINDGPMASFTAAVELAAASDPADADSVSDGVFAHTLGTELGTGWVTGEGTIPDIPLEVYNFIIDLGSRPERAYGCDDLRSVNNFNTGLPGTLQKYCSQSGAFRLALKYFPAERPDLMRELEEKGYAARRGDAWFVPVEPVDQRKPFLEHLMALPDREKDETTRKIWREIGEYLAATLLETKRILDPASDRRFLFGRLVKNRTCFDLMVEGGRRVKEDLSFVVAGTGMANTPLMKQLEAHPEYTVAQFAQAIGAVYFANAK
jgi:hypothetical protein